MGRGERRKREDHRGGHCDRPGSNAAGEGEKGPVPHVPGRWSPEVCHRPGWQRRRTGKGSGLFRQNQGRLREEGARGEDWAHPERDVTWTGTDVQSSGTGLSADGPPAPSAKTRGSESYTWPARVCCEACTVLFNLDFISSVSRVQISSLSRKTGRSGKSGPPVLRGAERRPAPPGPASNRSPRLANLPPRRPPRAAEFTCLAPGSNCCGTTLAKPELLPFLPLEPKSSLRSSPRQTSEHEPCLERTRRRQTRTATERGGNATPAGDTSTPPAPLVRARLGFRTREPRQSTRRGPATR